MQTFIKKDLIEEVSRRTGMKQVETAKIVNQLFRSLGDLMVSGSPECRIEIRDFGVFEVKRTSAKPKARNPRTNEIVYVPPRRKTHFKPGKRLKTLLHQALPD